MSSRLPSFLASFPPVCEEVLLWGPYRVQLFSTPVCFISGPHRWSYEPTAFVPPAPSLKKKLSQALPLCLGTLQTLSHCYLSLSVQSCLNVLSWQTSNTECPEWVEPEQPVCWMVLCCLLLYPRVGLDCYHVPARLPQGLHCLCHQLTVKPLEGPRLVLLWHVSHLSDVPRLHNLQKSPITLLYS